MPRFFSQDERDALLYHVLAQEPGLVIVFVNAISALRRLISLLKILRLPAEGLHGNMQQRARLKTLDRFRAAIQPPPGEQEQASPPPKEPTTAPNSKPRRVSVLVATDVAARGIDVKGVDLVVHYQIPLSADTYVHRSGRTGRADAEGASVALVVPSERGRYKRMLSALGRGRDGALPAHPTVEVAVSEAKRRLALARRIDALAHAKHRDAADAEWRRTNAAELGIELDSDEEREGNAARVFADAERRRKERASAKAKRAFERARARRRRDGADDDASDASDASDEDGSSSSSSSSDGDGMSDLVAAGFDRDDQASHARLGAHETREREEARLRAELDAALETPLGRAAERRLGVASAKYPTRGDGGERLAEAKRRREDRADHPGGEGADGSAGVGAARMLKGGKRRAEAMGAAPGGAAGKNRKRTKAR